MTRCCLPAFALIVAAAAPPVLADTYKWVDESGVVNYANSPPPGKAFKALRVGDRISVVASDPSLGPAIAAMHEQAARRAQNEEADWQQRQRFLLAARTNYPSAYGGSYDPYSGSYYPYYVPAFASGALRRLSPLFMQQPSFSSIGRGTTQYGRGSWR